MKPTTIATIRTVQPFAVTGIVIDLVRRWTGIELSPTEVLAAGVAIGGVVYRAGRELERRWPWIGRVLFGSTVQPTYGPQG